MGFVDDRGKAAAYGLKLQREAEPQCLTPPMPQEWGLDLDPEAHPQLPLPELLSQLPQLLFVVPPSPTELGGR
ncbi:UNVERIFIED_CONTAM: hypothetical protein K2H54_056306 [Gekko kuhli]